MKSPPQVVGYERAKIGTHKDQATKKPPKIAELSGGSSTATKHRLACSLGKSSEPTEDGSSEQVQRGEGEGD